MIQGMGGLMSITGERDDLPGGGPQKAGVAVADLMTGMYSTVGILAALHERSRSGLGQHVDMALLDCQVAMLANQNLNYMTSGKAPPRGSAHQNLVPYPSRRQRQPPDRGREQRQPVPQLLWRHRPARAVRRSALLDQSAARENREELVPLLAERMATGARDHWLAALEGVGVPAGPINTLDQVCEDPQVLARGMKRELPHPAAGKVPMAASPLKLSGSPVDTAAPRPCWASTRRRCCPKLGLSADEIQALAQGQA